MRKKALKAGRQGSKFQTELTWSLTFIRYVAQLPEQQRNRLQTEVFTMLAHHQSKDNIETSRLPKEICFEIGVFFHSLYRLVKKRANFKTNNIFRQSIRSYIVLALHWPKSVSLISAQVVPGLCEKSSQFRKDDFKKLTIVNYPIFFTEIQDLLQRKKYISSDKINYSLCFIYDSPSALVA